MTICISLITLVMLAFSAVSASGEEAFMTISSPAFGHNGYIPERHTCDGQDVSPPLVIEGVPPGTKSLALIVDDPDAPVGTWVHWVVWDIRPDTKEIGEGAVPQGARQGMNDFRKHDYGGPCPPSGVHRYFFKLYALDSVLGLGDKAKKADLEKAMKGHVIGQAEFIGLYRRK